MTELKNNKLWQNGRQLNDEFEAIKDAYVIPRFTSEEPNEVLMEQAMVRERLKINQAR